MEDVITYVSFADKTKCFGILLIKGKLTAVDASKSAHLLGLNPGGQAMAMTIRPSDKDIPPGMFDVMMANTGRLISPEEARVLFDARPIKELRKLLENS